VNVCRPVLDHPEDQLALVDRDGSWTWGELRAAAAAWAAVLAAAGVGPGDRVALVAPASRQLVARYLAILALGAVAAPLNPTSPATELARELDLLRPALVVADPLTQSEVDQARRLARAAVAALAPDAVPAGAAAVGTAPLVVADRARSDPALVLMTSGTASLPKPAVLAHGNLLANLDQLQAVPGVRPGPQDVLVVPVPLCHVLGLNVGLGLGLASGRPVVVAERLDPEELAAWVLAQRATMVVAVPTVFVDWLAEGPGRADRLAALRCLRLAVAGGAALPPGLAEIAHHELGLSLHQGYGLTEASPAVATTVGCEVLRPGSSGRPLPGVALKVVEAEGTPVEEGDPGEIWVRGPNVFAGYLDDPRATAAVLGPDGWLRTGDLGVLDEEGELWVVDRRKDLVVVSGFNVAPAEVEAVLAGAPGVAAVAVVGVPDPRTGEAVAAAVVPVDPTQPPDPEALRAYCASHLARYKCPTVVRVVPDLPRSASGELQRHVVAASFA
jgi:long-chain acyl-CoA synthetase